MESRDFFYPKIAFCRTDRKRIWKLYHRNSRTRSRTTIKILFVRKLCIINTLTAWDSFNGNELEYLLETRHKFIWSTLHTHSLAYQHACIPEKFCCVPRVLCNRRSKKKHEDFFSICLHAITNNEPFSCMKKKQTHEC